MFDLCRSLCENILHDHNYIQDENDLVTDRACDKLCKVCIDMT